MNNYKHWLVEIDMLQPSEAVLHNISILSQRLKPETIHFLHVAEKVDLPDEAFAQMPDLQVPEVKSIAKQLNDHIQDKIDTSIKASVEVIIGSPLKEILKKAQGLSVDLLLVGNRKDFDTLHKKVIRKAPCSVLLVPDKKLETLESILVPIDFSEYSPLCMEAVRAVSDDFDVKQVNVIHFYQDASFYLNQVFESPFEVNELMRRKVVLNEKLSTYASHKVDEFISEYKSLNSVTGIAEKLEKGENVDDHLKAALVSHNPDMLIMGAKGTSSSSAALLGTVAENIESKGLDKYLLIIKKKGENSSLIRTLLGLK